MKKPNVLLVIPRYFSTKEYGYVMPLGILYVSAALKSSNVANVYTLNLNHCADDDETILRNWLETYSIDIVGSSGISGQFMEVYLLFQLIRKINPKIKIIVGGGMITSDAVSAMEAFGTTVDYGCIGEGERTVPELVTSIYENLPISGVKGVIYRGRGEWVITPRREEIMDLDSIAFPDYAGFDYDKYLATNGEVENGVKYSPVAIIGGRSCKYNCTFCFHPSGSCYRQRSLDSIFAEIDYLMTHYDVNYVALREELFASDAQRVLDFCERMKAYPIVWSIQLRVDNVSPEIVNALKHSKCRYIFLGIESADNRILKSMRKNITIEQVEAALSMCIEAGLDTRSTLILGDEAETVESAERTISWWLAHKKHSAIDIGLIIAFPGSTLYKRAVKNGKIPDTVRFLSDGCPVINLSRYMNFEQFQQIADKVAKHSGISFHIVDYSTLARS